MYPLLKQLGKKPSSLIGLKLICLGEYYEDGFIPTINQKPDIITYIDKDFDDLKQAYYDSKNNWWGTIERTEIVDNKYVKYHMSDVSYNL